MWRSSRSQHRGELTLHLLRLPSREPNPIPGNSEYPLANQPRPRAGEAVSLNAPRHPIFRLRSASSTHACHVCSLHTAPSQDRHNTLPLAVCEHACYLLLRTATQKLADCVLCLTARPRQKKKKKNLHIGETATIRPPDRRRQRPINALDLPNRPAPPAGIPRSRYFSGDVPYPE